MLMDKRFIVLLLSLVLMLVLLASCSIQDSLETSDSSGDVAVNTPAINVSVKPQNGRISDFYSSNAGNPVTSEAIASYISRFDCSDSLRTLYFNSDEVHSIPILGPYLEETSLCVCLFKKQGDLIGTRSLAVDLSGNVTSELEELLGETYKGTTFEDSYCFSVIYDCISSYPAFEIQGIVYDESGYMMIYPVGNNATDDTVMFYNYKLMEFSLVDSFTSLDEGREKFNVYWNFRANELSRIPIYEWANITLYSMGYINKYRYEDVYFSDINVASCQYLFDFDWHIAVPLLNDVGEEGKCVLYLLYQKDKLIAEIVLEQKSDGVISLRKERISDRDAKMDAYVGLADIEYVEQVNQLMSTASRNIKGIGFDGEEYFVVCR